MSKAFVVKNKEGKYLRGVYGKNGETCWTTDIIDAMVYELNEFVPQPIENCILVPITITEGNLEEGTEQLKEQLAEKDREITYLEDCNKSLSNKFDKESDMQNKIDILEYNVEGLEEQLREKDKEIKELKMSVLFEQEHKNKALDELKQLRKQVCDMARKKIVEATCYDTEEEVRNVIYDLNASQALEILDEIEKGERNER